MSVASQSCPRVLRSRASWAHTKPATDSSVAGSLGARGQPWLQLGGSGGHGGLALNHWFSMGWMWPPRAHRAVLQTFWVVPFEGGGGCWHVAGRGWGCWETRCRVQGSTPPQQEMLQPQMLTVPRLRNPAPVVLLVGSMSVVWGGGSL